MAPASACRPADRAAIAADLVEVFLDDPVLGWVFPDRARRHRYSRPFFDLHARRSVAGGTAWRVDGGALLDIERQHPVAPHLYLAVLGVRPDRQGHSLGGVLLTPGLAYADEHRLPCYLESSNPRNVPFYERHGFEVRGDLSLAGAGPVVTFMWRRPA